MPFSTWQCISDSCILMSYTSATIIVSTSRTSILGFYSTNVCPAKDKHWPWYSLGSPLAERIPFLLVQNAKSWHYMKKPWGYQGEWSASGGPAAKNPWGLQPLGFWPCDLPRHHINHNTPSAFPNIVPTSKRHFSQSQNIHILEITA